MPTVPRYPVGGQVRTAALPGVRRSPGAPAEAFGGGAANAAGAIDLSGVQRVAEQVYLEERRKANDIALLDADNQAWELEKGLFHDPEKGAFSQRGKIAIDAGDKAVEKWTEGVSKIEASLSNESQRIAFRARAAARGQSLDGQLQNHLQTERQAYDNDTTKASIANRTDQAALAFRDPAKVDEIVAEQRSVISLFGQRNGIAPEVIAEQLAGTESNTRKAVIGRMLANGEDRGAQKYFDAHKERFTGADATDLERVLEAATTDGAGMRAADEAWKTLGPQGVNDPVKIATMEQSIRDQYADEPKVIKAAIADLRSRAQAHGAEQTELAASNKAAVLKAYNDGAPLAALTRLPAYLALSGTDQEEIRRHVVDRGYTLQQRGRADAAYRESEKEKAGLAEYWALSDPRALLAKSDNQILAMQPKLGVDLVNRLMGQKRQLESSEERVIAATIDADQFKHLARQAGVDPDDKDNAGDIGSIKYRVEAEIDAAQSVKGKALTRTEKDELTRRVLDEKVMLRDRFGFDDERLAALVTEDDRGRVYIPIEHVPQSSVSAYLGWLRSIGQIRPQTTDAVAAKQLRKRLESAYGAAILGSDRSEIEAILRGQR